MIVDGSRTSTVNNFVTRARSVCNEIVAPRTQSAMELTEVRYSGGWQ